MSLRKLTVTPLVGGALLWGWGVLREALNHSPTVSRIPGGLAWPHNSHEVQRVWLSWGLDLPPW